MTSNPRRVLGIDPGLARFGWAVVELSGTAPRLDGAGCLTTRAGQPDAERLHQLHTELAELIQHHRPTMMAVEKLFLTKNVSTAMAVGQARGVALEAAAAVHIPVAEFTPTTVKQTVTGYGRADKRQVQTMIKSLLRLKEAPSSDDMADAIAIALCGLHQPTWVEAA